MNKAAKLLPMDELVPIIEEVISTNGEFRLYPKGTSMLPLIVQGRDSVVLIKADKLKKNDIVLYRRKTGQYVLHRIVKIKDNSITMCGDNQFMVEKGISHSQIIAKVKGIYVNNSYLDDSSKKYNKYLVTLGFKRRLKLICYYIKRIIKKCLRKIIGEKQK